MKLHDFEPLVERLRAWLERCPQAKIMIGAVADEGGEFRVAIRMLDWPADHLVALAEVLLDQLQAGFKAAGQAGMARRLQQALDALQREDLETREVAGRG